MNPNISSGEDHTSNVTALQDLTGDILENTQNAVSVLNDLLNYDKIESGTFQLEFGHVNIWNLVEKTVSEFSIQARNRHVEIELASVSPSALSVSGQPQDGLDRDVENAPDMSSLTVIGDDIRLTQAIRNLISNALKFSPMDGEGRITVRTSYSTTRVFASPSGKNAAPQQQRNRLMGSVQIAVKDNGVGLSKDRLALLFTEGLQFDANKLQSGGGSGLGLCITKEIIEHHGGSIQAFSDGPGKGTMFVIEIPLYQIDPERSEDPTRAVQAESVTNANAISSHIASRSRSRRILIVDDSISNTKMLSRLLLRSGHSCHVAMDGQQAIRMYKKSLQEGQQPYDTILMDNQMPMMCGPETTKHLREIGCSCLILGVTGNVLAEDVAVFKASGVDHVLPKPLNVGAIEAFWTNAENSGRR
eukprot:scaffold43364_cov290-Amphora_coffeaeformis.AAC.2